MSDRPGEFDDIAQFGEKGAEIRRMISPKEVSFCEKNPDRPCGANRGFRIISSWFKICERYYIWSKGIYDKAEGNPPPTYAVNLFNVESFLSPLTDGGCAALAPRSRGVYQLLCCEAMLSTV